MKVVIGCVRVFVLVALASADQTYVIKAGRLIDSPSAAILTNAVIVVQENKIGAIGSPQTTIPRDAITLDPRDKTVLPGFIRRHRGGW